MSCMTCTSLRLPSFQFGSAFSAVGGHIVRTTNTFFMPSYDDTDSTSNCSHTSNAVCLSIQEAFASELDLPHVDLEVIEACRGSADALEELAIKLHVQTQSAIRVFEMLDEAGKGMVVLEDLQRVAPEILGEDDARDDDLVEMVNQVDPSGEGFLTRDDMIRIARKVGL